VQRSKEKCRGGMEGKQNDSPGKRADFKALLRAIKDRHYVPFI
jgi:hypothetical protein